MMLDGLAHAGAWYVDSAERVRTRAALGMDFFIVPTVIGDAAFDETYAQIQALGLYTIALLPGIVDPWASARACRRLAGRGVYGWILSDEPNVGGTPMALDTQLEWAAEARAIDRSVKIVASYHIEPTGPSSPERVVQAPGLIEIGLLNYYPGHWGVTDEQAGANLRAACAAARSFFSPDFPLIPVQQVAGSTVDRRPDEWARPIPGLLAPQHDIWAASGLMKVTNAACWYGACGTCAEEDWNALTLPAVSDELAAVIATHRS